MTGPMPANDSSDNGSMLGTGPKPTPDQRVPRAGTRTKASKGAGAQSHRPQRTWVKERRIWELLRDQERKGRDLGQDPTIL